MKKLILLLLLFLSFIGFSYAGGDDRDLQEFLNNSAEQVKEDSNSSIESTQEKASQASENKDEDLNKVVEELERQPQENEKTINGTTGNDKEDKRTNIEIFKEDYIESFQGGFMTLFIFVLIIVIIALNFFRK
jgi:predicted RND superfamily exporter protein